MKRGLVVYITEDNLLTVCPINTKTHRKFFDVLQPMFLNHSERMSPTVDFCDPGKPDSTLRKVIIMKEIITFVNK